MADVEKKAAKQLTEITECPICMSDFTDPRMLPCIHTFCFECLKRTGEEAQMKPGDKMPCPLCRKEFIIPVEGMIGVPNNFFMENLLELKTTLQMERDTIVFCAMCNLINDGHTGEISKASLRCLDCRENYCDSCVKIHQLRKNNRNHQILKIGSDYILKPDFSFNLCIKHGSKPLRYYCSDCKEIVCVCCVVESHQSHDCKDVTAVYEEFHRAIGKKEWLISNYVDELTSMREDTEKRIEKFLKGICESEIAIYQRNQQLKELIDRDTKSLLYELSAIKSYQLERMEWEMEEIDRSCTTLKSFEAYCTELRLKGSASDICSSVDQLLTRADDLEREYEAIIGRPYQSVEVSFQAAASLDALQGFKNNCVGEVKEIPSQYENYAIVVGYTHGPSISEDVIKINLARPNEISTQEQIPCTVHFEAVAAVYCNIMYVSGVGADGDEIWRYSFASGWMKCTSLIQGRNGHSAAFIDEILYICGGHEVCEEIVIDSVEAYNAIIDKCMTVGKLVHCVKYSGNCVPFNSSLYIFGGMDKDNKDLNCVQVYNTKTNTCSVLSKPMPQSLFFMRAVLWETSVILVGCCTCLIFDFESETWQERTQFKTGVFFSGLLVQDDKVFVIGGGFGGAKEKDGKIIWKCRDDIRYVPIQNIIDDEPVEWKIHGKLPKASNVHTYAILSNKLY